MSGTHLVPTLQYIFLLFYLKKKKHFLFYFQIFLCVDILRRAFWLPTNGDNKLHKIENVNVLLSANDATSIRSILVVE